jgi:hypothetical protein
MATPAQVRDLIDRGVLAPRVETTLSALWSVAGAEIASLIETATQVVAGADASERAKAA